MSKILANFLEKLATALAQKNFQIDPYTMHTLCAYNKEYVGKSERVYLHVDDNGKIKIIISDYLWVPNSLHVDKKDAILRDHKDFFSVNKIGNIEKIISIDSEKCPDVENIADRIVQAYTIAVTM